MKTISHILSTAAAIALVALGIYTAYAVGSDKRLNEAVTEAAQAAEARALEDLEQTNAKLREIRAQAAQLLAAIE